MLRSVFPPGISTLGPERSFEEEFGLDNQYRPKKIYIKAKGPSTYKRGGPHYGATEQSIKCEASMMFKTARGCKEGLIILNYNFLYFRSVLFLKFLLPSVVPVLDIYIHLLIQFGMTAFCPTSLLVCLCVCVCCNLWMLIQPFVV